MDTYKEEAGRRLKEARDEADLTLQEACARVPGLTVSRLGNWEQGTRTMPNEFAKKLAKVYGVSAAWLACLDDNKGEDTKKDKLMKIYDQLDERGRQHVLRSAEAECEYIVGSQQGRTTSAQ